MNQEGVIYVVEENTDLRLSIQYGLEGILEKVVVENFPNQKIALRNFKKTDPSSFPIMYFIGVSPQDFKYVGETVVSSCYWPLYVYLREHGLSDDVIFMVESGFEYEAFLKKLGVQYISIYDVVEIMSDSYEIKDTIKIT